MPNGYSFNSLACQDNVGQPYNYEYQTFWGPRYQTVNYGKESLTFFIVSDNTRLTISNLTVWEKARILESRKTIDNEVIIEPGDMLIKCSERTPTVQTCVFNSLKLYMEDMFGPPNLSTDDKEWFSLHPLTEQNGVSTYNIPDIIHELVYPYGFGVSRIQVTTGSYLNHTPLSRWMEALSVNPLALLDKATSNTKFSETCGVPLSEIDGKYRFQFQNEALSPAVIARTMISEEICLGDANYFRKSRWRKDNTLAQLSVQIDRRTMYDCGIVPEQRDFKKMDRTYSINWTELNALSKQKNPATLPSLESQKKSGSISSPGTALIGTKNPTYSIWKKKEKKTVGNLEKEVEKVKERLGLNPLVYENYTLLPLEVQDNIVERSKFNSAIEAYAIARVFSVWGMYSSARYYGVKIKEIQELMDKNLDHDKLLKAIPISIATKVKKQSDYSDMRSANPIESSMLRISHPYALLCMDVRKWLSNMHEPEKLRIVKKVETLDLVYKYPEIAFKKSSGLWAFSWLYGRTNKFSTWESPGIKKIALYIAEEVLKSAEALTILSREIEKKKGNVLL